MIKWETHNTEEEPVRLPKSFLWTAALIILGAFLYSTFLWLRWLTILSYNNQSLLVWLQL